MEIRNLITFIHVAEMNSFTKAATQLGYSQSTVSFQIKALEDVMDVVVDSDIALVAVVFAAQFIIILF